MINHVLLKIIRQYNRCSAVTYPGEFTLLIEFADKFNSKTYDECS